MHFPRGMTIRDLKDLILMMPDIDEFGEAYEVWMSTGRRSIPVAKASPLSKDKGDILLEAVDEPDGKSMPTYADVVRIKERIRYLAVNDVVAAAIVRMARTIIFSDADEDDKVLTLIASLFIDRRAVELVMDAIASE